MSTSTKSDKLTTKEEEVSSVGWEAPSNIALVKYWGKKGDQIPANPSLSLTLANSKTVTILNWKKRKTKLLSTEPVSFSYFFEGRENTDFSYKVGLYLEKLRPIFPEFEFFDLEFNSNNTFPHSSGIASSASSMAALALCLGDFHSSVKGEDFTREKMSSLARQASGSASRSLAGPMMSWGEISDDYASAVDLSEIHHSFHGLRNAILLVDDREKTISSRMGHKTMQDHPYAPVRYQKAWKNFAQIKEALKKGDWELFSHIVEGEALELHALMLSAESPYCLLRPGSLWAIEKIKSVGVKERGLLLTFTIDAGPNIHLLYPKSAELKVKSFIEEEIAPHSDMVKNIIFDEMGEGPKKLI